MAGRESESRQPLNIQIPHNIPHNNHNDQLYSEVRTPITKDTMKNKMSILEIVRLRQKQILEYKDRTEKEDNERTALRVDFFQPIRNTITELSEYGATYLKDGVVTSLEPIRDDAHEFQLIFRKPDTEFHGGVMAKAYLGVDRTPLIRLSDSSGLVINPNGIKSYSNADSAALKLAEILAPHLTLPPE